MSVIKVDYGETSGGSLLVTYNYSGAYSTIFMDMPLNIIKNISATQSSGSSKTYFFIINGIDDKTNIEYRSATTGNTISYTESEIENILQSHPNAFIRIRPEDGTTTITGTLDIEYILRH